MIVCQPMFIKHLAHDWLSGHWDTRLCVCVCVLVYVFVYTFIYMKTFKHIRLIPVERNKNDNKDRVEGLWKLGPQEIVDFM